MANMEKKAEKYYLSIDQKCPVIAKHSRNLNLCYVTGKLDPCYHRDGLIQTIQRLLMRKNKANILLTGPAGCGKTAIAEGLAAAITQRKLEQVWQEMLEEQQYKTALRRWERGGKVGEPPEKLIQTEQTAAPLSECVIYELSLNSLVSGARYRGDFEDRLEDVIRECRKNPNIILFIDEMHHLCRVGAAEGCVSAGQILKPALARGDIRLVGATTTEEKAMLLEDKALARRFTELEVSELTGNAVTETAREILTNYSAYHKVQTAVKAESILEQIRFYLPNTVFPDNFINVVDETLAGAAFDGVPTVDMTHFNQTLSRLTGRIIICTAQAS